MRLERRGGIALHGELRVQLGQLPCEWFLRVTNAVGYRSGDPPPW